MPNAIAVDATGMYITGFTGSNNFGTDAFYAGGGGDVFVAKIDTYGQFLDYATVWGGSTDEDGYAIAVDASQNVYVTGITYSSDYPTSQRITGNKPFQANFGGVRDAFVAKLNQYGAITYSTYLGGSQYDSAQGIAVDSTGHAFVTGITFSLNFPTKGTSKSIPNGGGTNAFVTELTPDGSGVVYSIYLGGNILNNIPPVDQGAAIAVDKSDNAFVTGLTCSTNFPVTAGAFQTTQPVACNALSATAPSSSFVTKLSSAGLITYSTYLGGNGSTATSSIALNGSGQVYVAGYTSSTSFLNGYSISPNPTAGFVAKLTPTLSAVSSNTFLGAQINGIAVVGGAVISVVAPSTTTIYTAGARYVPGSNLSNVNNIDGFVVKLTDTTGGIVITNPIGVNPVATTASGSSTSTATSPTTTTPVSTGVLATGITASSTGTATTAPATLGTLTTATLNP